MSIVLRPGTATPPLAGHPWIFSGAIAHLVPGPATEVVPGIRCGLFDQHARYLGVGYYNAQSQIAVRMVATAVDALEPDKLPDLNKLAVQRLHEAAELRGLLGLPSALTTAYRLLNSDGDLLPGITVDRLGPGAVLQVSTAGGWLLREKLVQALRAQPFGCEWVLVRVPQDIHPSESLQGGLTETYGDVPTSLTVLHNGLRLQVEPYAGQKTGMYCDQRENHKFVAALALGRFVLDAFCHTGGFGLHAARAGASRVLCVDASQRAVDQTIQNATENALTVQAQCGDAVLALRHWAGQPPAERPSLVVIDPPKYATKTAALEPALKKYQALNAVALQAVRTGGWLVTCSCSGLVEPEAFLRMIGQAANEAGVSVQLCALRGAAADHPTAPAHAEGRYLKVAVLRVLAKA